MHLSRVYCLLPGPPTTSKQSNVQHSGLVSMQLCDSLQSSIWSPSVHCARDQGVWLTRDDLRTRVTGMAGNGSEQSLCPKILGSVQIWCLTGCVSDDYKGTGNRDPRSLVTSSYITALAPGPPGHAIGDVSLSSSVCSYLGQDIVMFCPSWDILIAV